jgi:hypothetical protein
LEIADFSILVDLDRLLEIMPQSQAGGDFVDNPAQLI